MTISRHLITLSQNLLDHIIPAAASPHSHNETIFSTPPFLWRGDAGQGRWICANNLAYQGQHIKYNTHLWQNDTISKHDFWNHHAQSFAFLNDLRSLGGDTGRLKARTLVKEWIEQHTKRRAKTMQPGETAARISNWLIHFDFFGQTAPDTLIHMMTGSLIQQSQSLLRYPSKHIEAEESLYVAKALILSGLSITGQQKALTDGIALLNQSLQEQILSDGGHISRSPLVLLKWGMACLDIQAALQHSNETRAEFLPAYIGRITQALHFFAQMDGQLPNMHGGHAGFDDALASYFKAINGKKKKIPYELPITGYQRIKQGKTSLIMDTGGIPNFRHNSPCHAGLGAFELFLGKEKIVSNCGANPISSDWGRMLKSTAAHSTLTLDDRNTCEILSDGHIGSSPIHPECKRIPQADKSDYIEFSHDGYMPSLSTQHVRRIHCSADGLTLSGSDLLISEHKRPAPLEYNIRFHLHPMIKTSLIKNGHEVLLRMPSGKSAVFTSESLMLSIEESLIIGRDLNPRKTDQIVMNGRFSGGVEDTLWRFKFIP